MKHLAIDIGASGGRHIIGTVSNGQIALTEVYRFENKAAMQNGRLVWDSAHLFNEIIAGLKKCREANLVPDTLGVDTWGVDYALLDASDDLIGTTVCYRDKRTMGMDERLHQKLSASAHYALCGIAEQPFNTVYQLMTEEMRDAKTFLMMPDYLHFLLTGIKANEYTNASTTGLLNAATRTWDKTVLNAAGIDPALFSAPLLMPATPLGSLSDAVSKKVGFQALVIVPATHDTGSAFMAVPARDENAVYLSSGTWSLLGVESGAPLLGDAHRAAGFTNEGGYGNKIRFLKNIMGLWILQSLRKEWDNRYTFSEMAQMAENGKAYQGTFDANHPRFLAPGSMVLEINQALSESGHPLPANDSQLLYAVYQSLVICYANAVSDLEIMTGKRYTSLNIVGGGSQNGTLNQMIANGLKRPVFAGPAEGTALGNIIAQMLATGEVSSLQEAREMIKESFAIQTFLPEED